MPRRSLGTEGHRDMTEGQPEHGLARLCAWGAPGSAFVLVNTELRVLGLCRAESAMPADRPVQMCPGWDTQGGGNLGVLPTSQSDAATNFSAYITLIPFLRSIVICTHIDTYIYKYMLTHTYMHTHTSYIYYFLFIRPFRNYHQPLHGALLFH